MFFICFFYIIWYLIRNFGIKEKNWSCGNYPMWIFLSYPTRLGHIFFVLLIMMLLFRSLQRQKMMPHFGQRIGIWSHFSPWQTTIQMELIKSTFLVWLGLAIFISGCNHICTFYFDFFTCTFASYLILSYSTIVFKSLNRRISNTYIEAIYLSNLADSIEIIKLLFHKFGCKKRCNFFLVEHN